MDVPSRDSHITMMRSSIARRAGILVLPLALWLFSRHGAIAADYYVALNGDDANPGTATKPFVSLARARNAVREKVAVGLDRNWLVLVRGGTYPQTRTLAFGPEDSGTERYSITYAAAPGETVVLSGGRKISGWKKGEGQLWTVELPEVKAGQWHFRQLFVGGRRATRARTPNADDQTPWWHIRTSSVAAVNYDPATNVPPPEDVEITVALTGRVQAYRNLRDVELVYIANNNNSRKPLGWVDEKEQVLTLSPPHHWNPKAFGTEWIYNIPSKGVACFLENALELLDQPGEWYLDRQTGFLTYWPRKGEDLSRDEVMAPVVPRTLLAVMGTREKPVTNLHFKGLHVNHIEWAVPSWGYLGMAVCTMAVGTDPEPGWRFVDAAVEFEHARSCSFVEGGIAHVGSMALCLRRGTASIVIEGNEIFDSGGGGIGAGYMENAAYGYVHAPPPERDECCEYRIANNYVHDCGTDDFGAAGILLAECKDSVVAHNLIHDTAYFGIGFAGSQKAKVPFAGNNLIENNEIYRAMKVTVDGAGLYATFDQAGESSRIRGNVIHDISPNRFNHRALGPYSAAGIYLDGGNSGCRYERNICWNTTSPLFGNGPGRNAWAENIFVNSGSPPPEFVEAVRICAGLEPAWRRSLMKTESEVCDFHALTSEASVRDGWTAGEYNMSKAGRGVVQVFRRVEGQEVSLRLKLRDLDAAAQYKIKRFVGLLHESSGNSQSDPPILSGVEALPSSGQEPSSPSGSLKFTGRELMEQGLPVKLPASPHVTWTVYQRINTL